jgi:hypothetical protein
MYNIDIGSGVVAPTPIVIGQTATPVAATFLRANGDVEPLVTAAEFELQFNDLNTNIVTFTRTGAFTGTLTGVAAGTDVVTVVLYHKEAMHEEYEIPNVNLQVN